MNASTALRTYLDFEKPILELESKVAELKALHVEGKGPQIADEIAKLEQKAKAALVDTYARLTPCKKPSSRGIPSVRTRSISSTDSLRTSRRSRVTAISPRTKRSSAASENFAIDRSSFSGMRRARTPNSGSSTISAWRGRRGIARPCA